MEPKQLSKAVRRDIFACMETGNIDRARTVLQEYRAAIREVPGAPDDSDDIRTDVVAAYGVSI